MPFFNYFSRQNQCSFAHILSKKVQSLKNTQLSCPYFVKKRPFSQNTILSSHFFQFFMKILMLSYTCLVKKTSILLKLHSIMGQKSQQDALFFRFLTKKSLLSCPCFVKKRPFSKKQTALISKFCQTNFHSLKNTVFSCHFFQNCS